MATPTDTDPSLVVPSVEEPSENNTPSGCYRSAEQPTKSSKRNDVHREDRGFHIRSEQVLTTDAHPIEQYHYQDGGYCHSDPRRQRRDKSEVHSVFSVNSSQKSGNEAGHSCRCDSRRLLDENRVEYDENTDNYTGEYALPPPQETIFRRRIRRRFHNVLHW